MTADDVSREVCRELPEVDLSTVYRTLDLLVTLDLVTRTRLAGATAFYEVAPDPVHHHLLCERCGAIDHLDDAAFSTIYERLDRERGFVATRLQATVVGVCAACRKDADAHP